ncbi:sodium:calcium antiporter, partial [Cyanobium sp. HWJ4-Hawea]|nr:sodium:calcium antiporter [Cyanobium sp. HWJ4-Hawea]
TLVCVPIFWSGGVITRLEGGLLLGLYGLYLVEQLVLNMLPAALDEFRLVVLVAVLPAVLVCVTWSALAWRRKSRAT